MQQPVRPGGRWSGTQSGKGSPGTAPRSCSKRNPRRRRGHWRRIHSPRVIGFNESAADAADLCDHQPPAIGLTATTARNKLDVRDARTGLRHWTRSRSASGDPAVRSKLLPSRWFGDRRGTGPRLGPAASGWVVNTYRPARSELVSALPATKPGDSRAAIGGYLSDSRTGGRSGSRCVNSITTRPAIRFSRSLMTCSIRSLGGPRASCSARPGPQPISRPTP